MRRFSQGPPPLSLSAVLRPGRKPLTPMLGWSISLWLGSKMKHRRVLHCLAALAGVCLAPLALAKVMQNTIDPVAIVSGNGLHVMLTGPIACIEGERLSLRVTVTQRETGALAEGVALFTCTGVFFQQWKVLASIQGNETFQPGPATAVAIGRTSSGAKTTDAHQWLVNITLVGE